MIGHITNRYKYLGKLREGLMDKVDFMVNEIDLSNSILVDWGCANGFVGQYLLNLQERAPALNGFEYLGYDYDVKMIRSGNLEFPYLNLTSDLSEIISHLHNARFVEGKRVILFLSSTLHEILPFESAIKDLIHFTESIKPTEIVIRDMYHTGPNKELTEVLLKTAYVDNFKHEMDENYFAWSGRDELLLGPYKITYDKTYVPYWINNRLHKFAAIDGYDWIDKITTHRKLILKRVNN